jgi:tRNA threonylcarbamoyladenosine biosynthesis protein TsaE
VEGVTRSEGQTEGLGARIAAIPGLEFLALCGDLGTGKTALVRGLARGLGVGEGVQSPTYVLGRRYAGTRPLWHFDFYRLERESDLEALDWPPAEKGVLTAVEWADKFPGVFPEGTLWVRLEFRRGSGRTLRIGGRAS